VLVLNSLSRTLLEQNKYKEALNYIQDSFAIAEARRLLKDLPGLVELAIEAVTPLQQVSRAQDYCARALKLAPDNRKLQQLRKQLNSHT
jgi:hypothetical protein